MFVVALFFPTCRLQQFFLFSISLHDSSCGCSGSTGHYHSRMFLHSAQETRYIENSAMVLLIRYHKLYQKLKWLVHSNYKSIFSYLLSAVLCSFCLISLSHVAHSNENHVTCTSLSWNIMCVTQENPQNMTFSQNVNKENPQTFHGQIPRFIFCLYSAATSLDMPAQSPL